MIQEPNGKTDLCSYHSNTGCIRCISWSAIIVPALIAVGLSFLLNIFTDGLGLTAYTSTTTGQISLMIGGFVWLIIASYAIMFLVGWIAGDMAQPYSRCSGVLHGFAAWCLALIITIALLSQSATSALGSPAYYSINPITTTSKVISNSQNLDAQNTPATPTVNKLGIGVLGIFFIFLAGALGSCTGGYVGSKSNPNKRENNLQR